MGGGEGNGFNNRGCTFILGDDKGYKISKYHPIPHLSSLLNVLCIVILSRRGGGGRFKILDGGGVMINYRWIITIYIISVLYPLKLENNIYKF